MIRSIPATKLKIGDVLALPMGKTAHVANVRLGRTFVSFKTDEYGQSRV